MPPLPEEFIMPSGGIELLAGGTLIVLAGKETFAEVEANANPVTPLDVRSIQR
jgi:hypothetical protein